MNFEGITTETLLSRANEDRKNIIDNVTGLLRAHWGLRIGREEAISPEELSLISAAIAAAPGRELGMKAEYILQFERNPIIGDIEPSRREICCLISCTSYSKSRRIEIKTFEIGRYGTSKHDFEF